MYIDVPPPATSVNLPKITLHHWSKIQTLYTCKCIGKNINAFAWCKPTLSGDRFKRSLHLKSLTLFKCYAVD